MLTLHAADLLRPGGDQPAVPGGAVLVDGHVIVAVGPCGELAAAHPQARIRRWPGVLTPGLANPDGQALLERTYHPDPREAEALGAEPLSGEALAALAMDDARWGASARRGIQRQLAQGTVALSGPFTKPAVREAVRRSGLRVTEGPLAELAPGAAASFAVFDGSTCVATVLAGRLVHRRR